jgi:hypothetical protein
MVRPFRLSALVALLVVSFGPAVAAACGGCGGPVGCPAAESCSAAAPTEAFAVGCACPVPRARPAAIAPAVPSTGELPISSTQAPVVPVGCLPALLSKVEPTRGASLSGPWSGLYLLHVALLI